jgi:hypothetical protein
VTAQVIPFPKKREQLIVRVVRDGEVRLVLTHRGHGWLHGNLFDALDDAAEIAEGFGVAVKVSA